ncbi:MAG: TRC40/GET3/ArsA family transport-energizing ATPase, partial [Candidatus Omnitrophica bacterium]|nr:TRC40/GET3/ArsA family transport-energizing ATPase [Candidatus Omnitrophota bacterium]
MSCATAVWFAKNGYKTLIVTTDPAPNLSDIFKQEIGHKITPIIGVENLSAIEINPDVAFKEYQERLIIPLKEILDQKTLQTIKDQLNSPCVEEVAAFDKFIEFMDDGQYDVVIFDTAPTGHTIRLLELPSGWHAAIEKNTYTCLGPSASLKDAKSKYEKAISYLRDKNKTSFIFVLRPENLSIFETKRSLEELKKLSITTSFLIINGLLPQEVCTDDFFKKKFLKQKAIITKINKEFKNIKKIFYPLMDLEVSGIELLTLIGNFLYEGKKITKSSIDNSEHPTHYLANDQEKIENIYNLLTPLNDTRYIFFIGKGGVGKSTIACTTALFLAQKGFKTLIVTTDPASHLAEIFKQRIWHQPTKISGIKNLYAARIDQKKAFAEYKKRILNALKDKDQETKKSIEEDLNSPCAQEMSAFEKFMS